MSHQRIKLFSRIKKHYSYHWIILGIILLVAVFFRFYNTPSRYGFDFDPMRDVLVANVGAHVLQLPITGPKSGIGPFAFGSWYYYQLIAAQFLMPFDYAPWIYLGIISLIFVFLMYKIGALLESRTLGLILAGIAAITPSQVGPTAGLSNPNFVPFYTALTIFIFLLILKRSQSLWLYLLWGVVFGLAVNHHYQAGGIIFLFIFYFVFNREKLFRRISATLLGTTIIFIPYFIFEFLTNWYNTKGLWFYATVGSKNIYVPNSWTIYLRDFWPPFWSYILGAPTLIGEILLVLSVIFAAFLLLKRKIRKEYLYIFSVLFVNIFLLKFFSGVREYYYFLYLHTLIFIFIGFLVVMALKHKWAKYFAILIIFCIVPFALKQDWIRDKSSQDNVKYHNETVFLKDKYPEKKFVFFECNEHERNKVLAFNFLLLKENKLDESGIKIGFLDKEGCGLSTLKNTQYIKEVDGWDISNNSQTTLLKAGWKKSNPLSVYNEAINWWKEL